MMCSDECLKLFESGKYEESLECYDKAVKIDPNNARVNFGKSLVLKALPYLLMNQHM